MGSEMRISVFFHKKSIFSKLLKLSATVSHRIRNGFGVLFQPLNDFEPTLIVFEKNRFFDKKKRSFSFLNSYAIPYQKRVFFHRKRIFFKDGEGRLKIIQRLKQDLKAGPNTIGYMSSKFQEFFKNWFFMKKTLILISDPISHSLPNVHFFIKKSIFFKDDEGRFKII